MAARVASRRDVAVLEANAVARGVPLDTLMENAGTAVAEEAVQHLPKAPAPVAVVCGVGNNGGDGLTAALRLSDWGFEVHVWLIRPPEEIASPLTRRRWEKVSTGPHVRVGLPTPEELTPFPLVISALTGTGAAGEPRGPALDTVRSMNAAGRPVLAVDVPTGLGTSHALKATWTVTLEVLKAGLDAPSAGVVTVRAIGIPPEAHTETGPGEFHLFPVPDRSTHKGAGGRLVIVGGGPYAGAPALAAFAALRAGVDMVFIVAPAPTAEVIQGFSPELIVRSVGSQGAFAGTDASALLATVMDLRPSAVLLGNGAGAAPGTVAALRDLARAVVPQTSVAFDADAVRLLEQGLPGTEPDRTLALPNPREFAHLLGRSLAADEPDRDGVVRKLAAEKSTTILAKGPTDIISDGDRVRHNATHHPAMVVGGAGDVLAGVAASLMARNVEPFEASRLASYWLGAASLRLFTRLSYGMTPLDLIAELPATLADGLHRLDLT